jgi:hypothetical protein
LIGQRIWFPFEVQGLDGVMDGPVKEVCVGEGLMGEIVGFEVSPDGFDVVEFGRVFGQLLNAEPMVAGGQRGLGGLAGMDRAVVERQKQRTRPVCFCAIRAISARSAPCARTFKAVFCSSVVVTANLPAMPSLHETIGELMHRPKPLASLNHPA